MNHPPGAGARTLARLLWLRAWLAVACLGLGTAGLAGATLADGPHAFVRTNATVAIVWQTDVATGSRVQFAPMGARLDGRANGTVGTNHLVVLTNLLAGTQYLYTVGTARQPLATNSFFVPRNPPGGTGATGPPVQVVPNRPPATASQAPPARVSWGHAESLGDHFDRHGADFGARSAEDYARLAWEFRQRARREGLPAKQDETGVIRVFDRRSGSFAAYNRDGTTRTYFKPGSADYFKRQPGRSVNLKLLEFAP